MRIKILTAFLASSLIITSFSANANCLDKYNNEISNRKDEIAIKQNELLAQKRSLEQLNQACFPSMPIAGSIVSILSIPLALSGLALLSPFVIYSAAATIATMAPFTLAGSAMLLGGVKLAKGTSVQSSACSDENFKTYAAAISKISYELINLKYLTYSQERISLLLSELSKNEAGPETIEFLRRMKIVLPDSKISNTKILSILNEVDQSELICEDSFMLTNMKSIEKGLEKVIDKSISISDVRNRKVSNPFIESEARARLTSLKLILDQVNQQIAGLKDANAKVMQSSSRVTQAMSAPENTLEERRGKYLDLINLSDILNNGLEVVLRADTSVESLERTRTAIRNEIKHINKILVLQN